MRLSASWSRSLRSARTAARLGLVKLAQEPGGQRPGAGTGHGAPVDRDLTANIAACRPEVPPVLLLDLPLTDQETEPDVERHGGVGGMNSSSRRSASMIPLLDHVRGVDAPLEPRVQTRRHHPPEPGAVTLEQFGDGVPVARGGAGDEVGDLTGRW